MKCQNCRVLLGQIKRDVKRIRELEGAICIAYDYLQDRYDMDSVPLHKITELYKLVENK